MASNEEAETPIALQILINIVTVGDFNPRSTCERYERLIFPLADTSSWDMPAASLASFTNIPIMTAFDHESNDQSTGCVCRDARGETSSRSRSAGAPGVAPSSLALAVVCLGPSAELSDVVGLPEQ